MLLFFALVSPLWTPLVYGQPVTETCHDLLMQEWTFPTTLK